MGWGVGMPLHPQISHACGTWLRSHCNWYRSMSEFPQFKILKGSNSSLLFLFEQLSQMKKAHDDLMASVKEEHRDEIAELDSKNSIAIDGKLMLIVCRLSQI